VTFLVAAGVAGALPGRMPSLDLGLFSEVEPKRTVEPSGASVLDDDVLMISVANRTLVGTRFSRNDEFWLIDGDSPPRERSPLKGLVDSEDDAPHGDGRGLSGDMVETGTTGIEILPAMPDLPG
jgi:hypothetical protein